MKTHDIRQVCNKIAKAELASLRAKRRALLVLEALGADQLDETTGTKDERRAAFWYAWLQKSSFLQGQL